MLGNSTRAKARTNVLGVRVSALDMDEAVQTLLNARADNRCGYVCVTGVHGVMESQRDPVLRKIHNQSFLTVPDGMPIVWVGREQGFTKMGRVYGPDLMLKVFEKTSALNQRTEDGLSDVALAKLEGRRTEAGGQEKTLECGGSLVRRSLGEGGTPLSDKVESACRYPSQDETGSLDIGEDQLTAISQQPVEDRGQRTEGRDQRAGVIPDLGSPISDKKCLTHFLYGATEATIEKLKANLEARFPGVQIVGTYAPPFRPLDASEEEELRLMVAACHPDFFWVGLSTPKQELFMASHDPRLLGLGSSDNNPEPSTLKPEPSAPRYPLEAGIMLGVGAAFDIHAGNYKDSPEWIKNSGLQWLHRLCLEPRRLWRRYFYIVPTFLWSSAMQLLGVQKYTLEE